MEEPGSERRDGVNAIEEAAVARLPSGPSGVAAWGGSTASVLLVMALLGISNGDAEVVFNHLPADPRAWRRTCGGGWSAEWASTHQLWLASSAG